jgi:hypothetical protein
VQTLQINDYLKAAKPKVNLVFFLLCSSKQFWFGFDICYGKEFGASRILSVMLPHLWFAGKAPSPHGYLCQSRLNSVDCIFTMCTTVGKTREAGKGLLNSHQCLNIFKFLKINVTCAKDPPSLS